MISSLMALAIPLERQHGLDNKLLVAPTSDNNPIEDPLNLSKHEEQPQTAQNNHRRKNTHKQTI